MKNFGMAYAIALGFFLISGLPTGTGQAIALECGVPKCPPHSKGTGGYELKECVLDKALDEDKACKPLKNACRPALTCHYVTAPGSKRPCGTRYRYVACLKDGK
jgi:hypothetical protein